MLFLETRENSKGQLYVKDLKVELLGKLYKLTEIRIELTLNRKLI